MAKPVQRLSGHERLNDAADGVHLFGIRHLSPSGARHLLSFLNDIRPTAVLVEGPSDASHLISQIASRGVVPPIALLAYTEEIPVRSLLYPLAAYSPEYQAFLWASREGAACEFIDLPSGHALALHGLKEKEAAERDEEERARYIRYHNGIYEHIAELADEPDYDAYWERYFEHNGNIGAYRSAIQAFSERMRQLTAEEELAYWPQETAYTDIREAYMRRRIQETIAAGHLPARIVVVTGAHHVSALGSDKPAMTDEERERLPLAPTRLTLMPYTYYKLSSRSGYGAGNRTPAYFQLFWECLHEDRLSELPKRYMSSLAAVLRDKGTYRSTASVIEGVRMAEALASMKGGSQPTWQDLRDASVVCLGGGEVSVVSEAHARIDIGTAIGLLPEGVSQTPVQDDLNRELRRLKLDKYKTPVAQNLELDLRENRRVQSEDAAYLDLNRSVLLHRLELLGISFARKLPLRQDAATWAEHWTLQWTPETEIGAVESTLKGETIEIAAAYVIHERLQTCTNIVEAARIIRMASLCRLLGAMDEAQRMLQTLTVDSDHFEGIAEAAFELSALIRYGSIRRHDTSSLVPLLQRLFLRGALSLGDAANCNNDAAASVLSAVQMLHSVAQEHYQDVDESLWMRELRRLASRDDRNPKLSGFGFAILLERDEYSPKDIEQEVSRRLSPGVSADLGAGWFEGVALLNRYALLSRASLWGQLDTYIGSLDDDQFRRSLVYLRRAFSSFEPREKAAISDMLGDLWGAGADETSILLQRPLTEEEKEKLDELNDFDFGEL
ncbi:DUF5682 family protein [Cohnella fermenti]|uniref:ChaN family lipoprotein n=1 Tax=Cohnella fermenti TaxID=2565925 RepID=A0A4S4C8R4_9BACL|nr:DUF5682 family protein [Cohnella fermenti]THF84429.1 hypothetical protein E6C55_00115 [Cohnella fermenti]